MILLHLAMVLRKVILILQLTWTVRMALGYMHNMSKRTMVYAAYMDVSDDNENAGSYGYVLMVHYLGTMVLATLIRVQAVSHWASNTLSNHF